MCSPACTDWPASPCRRVAQHWCSAEVGVDARADAGTGAQLLQLLGIGGGHVQVVGSAVPALQRVLGCARGRWQFAV